MTCAANTVSDQVYLYITPWYTPTKQGALSMLVLPIRGLDVVDSGFIPNYAEI